MTGSMPTEKRADLDLSDVREWLDRGDNMGWIPNGYLLVDAFTKHLADTPLMDSYLRDYLYNFTDQHSTLEREEAV
eukprot:1287209-Heterocapsa_arctica.AAC.1